MRKLLACRTLLCLCFLIDFAMFLNGRATADLQTAGALKPEVVKIEPPNWWVRHSINPVRVLIRGRNLAGARVEAHSADVRAGSTRSNAAGTYLFVDLRIDLKATPGSHSLKITTQGGTAEARFDVLAPPSRVGRFQGFSPDDLIYLIMPDRFSDGDPGNDDPPVSRGLFDRQKARYYHGGDLQGIIKHLAYLKDLGITDIWITPIYDNANQLNEREEYHQQAITDYHGYGAVDFYGVEEHFGDMAQLRELVGAAHGLGLKVIQDQVANHTGPLHPWVKDSPTPTWYHGTKTNHLDETWQTWTLMDPHATPETRRPTLEGWFAGILPDLDQNDPEVGRYLIQNTLWWIGMTGIDAIREDTLPYVPRRFWREWMAAIKREFRNFTVVGEVFDGDPALVSFFQGQWRRFDGIDSGVDTVFDFPLFFQIRRAFGQGEPLRGVPVTLSHDYLFPRPDLLVTFIGNHDVPRFMNEKGASIAGLKLADTFMLTARGIPMIYYGDEIAMPGGGDPDNRRDFPGGWPDDPRNAFEASGRTPDEEAVFEHVRRLAHLRAELEPLRRGSMIDLWVGEQTYVYARVTDRAAVIAAINNGTEPATVECSVAPAHLSNGVILADRLGGAPDVRVEDGRIRLSLAARAAGVYVVKGLPSK